MYVYYKITGMENGEPIEPFYVAQKLGDPNDRTLYHALGTSHGDSIRFGENVSKQEYEAKKGGEKK